MLFNKTKFNKSLLVVLAVMLIAIVVAPITITAVAAEKPNDFSAAESVLLYNVTDGATLIKSNTDKLIHTSTSAKIMTGLILCERLSDSLDDKVEITSEMLSGVSGMRANPPLQAGEIMTVRDLLYGAICGSYNDAAYALAYHVAGSSSDFAAFMNLRAKSLGADNTSYTNPLGYPDNDAMKTTADDVLKIVIAAYHNELFMEISSVYDYNTERTNLHESRRIKNKVELVTKKDSVYRGMNAGYTGDAGGWCVITAFEDEGHNYVSIVLGGKEGPNEEALAYDITRDICSWVRDEYNLLTLYHEGDVIGTTKVDLTALPTKNAPYVAASDFKVYVPYGVVEELEYEITPDLSSLKAPIKEGEVIGTIKALYDGKVVGECEIVMTKDYVKNPIVSGVQVLFEYTQSRAFIITVIIAFVLILIYVISNRFKRLHFNTKMRK